jgi:AAA15 family ATPase/GTPase
MNWSEISYNMLPIFLKQFLIDLLEKWLFIESIEECMHSKLRICELKWVLDIALTQLNIAIP